jgi:nifR3 family TIM-barrel protein
MSIFIKNVELKNNLILAPMAGYTDLAFRKMCKDFGAGLTCTEMVSAKALHYKSEKTAELLNTLDDECPKAVQIFGHEPEIMAEAVKNPLLDKFDIIDINMGCPAPKIYSNGDGSALMGNIELAEQIIKACVQATDKPITVKFRLGLTESSINAVEFAKMCESAGASAITVHGRTKVQGYSGIVDLEIIKKVKDAVNIPVFANGDCRCREDYLNMLKITGADGVMLGRSAIGKPEIFQEILTGEPVVVDKVKQVRFHYETMLKYHPEIYVVKFMRSHMAGYLSGKYKNSQALVKICKMEKYSEIDQFLTEIIG